MDSEFTQTLEDFTPLFVNFGKKHIVEKEVELQFDVGKFDLSDVLYKEVLVKEFC